MSERRFFEFLGSLDAQHPRPRPDRRAILASLRRGLGKPPGTVPDVLKWVYPHLELDPSLSPERRAALEDSFFITASLFALHPVSRRDGETLGRTLGRLRKGDGSESLDKRFEALIQCERRALPAHLRQAIRLGQSYGHPVDYRQLCIDIEQWDGDDRRVQRDWARDYWNPRRSDPSPDDPAAAAESISQQASPSDITDV